ncbi:MAG: 50S ribosomal protein L37ae [Nanoarchaeota archaeon]
MSPKTAKKGGSQKRFGARYGRKNRDKVGKIEQDQRATHPCPYCTYLKVKRVALGIWQCRKCDSRFTGRAYVPTGLVRRNE